ncbi:ABC-2 family transporter protein [candidate division TA06 bacterium]|nr:ABC-2 family transporter protein [candidate division TA06 bacterium]
MKPYWAVFKTRCAVMLQYRTAAVAGFCTQLFWGLILVMLYQALYHSSSGPKPMTLPQVISYIWLGQAMLLVLPWSNDRDVMQMIRDGGVGYELIRPVRLYGMWYSRFLATKVVPMTMRSIPIFLIAIPLLGLQPPASAAAAIAFAIAMLFGILLSTSIVVCMNILFFWTVSGEGLSQMLMVFTFLFSGTYIPLPLLPDWSQPIVSFLPFRGLMDIPFRLYLGQLPVRELPRLMQGQCLWIIFFVLAGHLLLRRGLKLVVIQGG